MRHLYQTSWRVSTSIRIRNRNPENDESSQLADHLNTPLLYSDPVSTVSLLTWLRCCTPTAIGPQALFKRLILFQFINSRRFWEFPKSFVRNNPRFSSLPHVHDTLLLDMLMEYGPPALGCQALFLDLLASALHQYDAEITSRIHRSKKTFTCLT